MRKRERFSKERFLKERLYEGVSKILLNLGHLVFASLALGSILKGDYDTQKMFYISCGVAVLLMAVGMLLHMKGGK
jgi:hypothetical protein